MRIGMILDKQFPPDPRVRNEAISLINAGHEVFLFCLNYSNLRATEIIDGIHVVRYPASKLLYKLSALVYTISCYSSSMKKKIDRFIKDHSIEVLHVHDIQVADAVFKANKKYKLGVVLDLHENRPEIMRFYPHLQRFPGKLMINPDTWRRKEESFVKQATEVIVVTEESKSELVKRVGLKEEKVAVVPNTVDRAYNIKWEIQSNIIDGFAKSFNLLYIGDTGLRRGLLTAIESLPTLVGLIPNIKLIIVGSNSSDNVLKDKVAELRVEKYVSFEGWQNENTFPSYITASDICISPLHANKHHHTTYANKIFQYMSLGKALLVSDVLAQQNIVNQAKAGLVHRAENSIDFVDKVKDLYANTEKRMEFGKNGAEFIENEFHWEKTSQNLIDLYSKLSK